LALPEGGFPSVSVSEPVCESESECALEASGEMMGLETG
jgi:hypothetical protein